MRTLEKMVARVRRYVNDVAKVEWTDAQVIAYLRDAAETLWGDILAHPQARRILLVRGEPVTVVEEQEQFTIPEDCLRLLNVDMKLDDDMPVWVRLWFADSAARIGITSGTASLAKPGCLSGPFPRWGLGDDDTQIKLLPVPSAGRKIRFVYLARPAFPDEENAESATFNDPLGSGTDTKHYPPRVVDAVEYYAAAMLAAEEVEGERAIGTWGQLYRKTVGEICRTGPRIPDKGAKFVRGIRR